MSNEIDLDKLVCYVFNVVMLLALIFVPCFACTCFYTANFPPVSEFRVGDVVEVKSGLYRGVNRQDRVEIIDGELDWRGFCYGWTYKVIRDHDKDRLRVKDSEIGRVPWGVLRVEEQQELWERAFKRCREKQKPSEE